MNHHAVELHVPPTSAHAKLRRVAAFAPVRSESANAREIRRIAVWPAPNWPTMPNADTKLRMRKYCPASCGLNTRVINAAQSAARAALLPRPAAIQNVPDAICRETGPNSAFCSVIQCWQRRQTNWNAEPRHRYHDASCVATCGKERVRWCRCIPCC